MLKVFFGTKHIKGENDRSMFFPSFPAAFQAPQWKKFLGWNADRWFVHGFNHLTPVGLRSDLPTKHLKKPSNDLLSVFNFKQMHFLKYFKGYFYWREKKTHTHFKVTLSKHESMAEFARCFVKWAFAFNSPRNSWWFDVVSTHIKSMCSALPLMMISSCFFLGDSWLNMAQPHWPVQRSMWIFFHALPTRLGWGSVWRTARLSRSKPEARWAQAVACDGTAIIMV